MRQSLPVHFSASGAIGPIPTGGAAVTLVGATIRATTAAVVNFRNQGAVSGDIIATFGIPANQSIPLGEVPCVRCQGQLYVEVVSGTVDGVAYIV